MMTTLDLDELERRIADSQRRIGSMCKEGRPPAMSIPADHERDDDLFICDTLRDCAAMIAAAKEAERLRRENAAWVDALNNGSLKAAEDRKVLEAEIARKNEALDEIDGCFNAALSEGLNNVLAETSDERLKDLVCRRLLFAHDAAITALSPATNTAQPVPRDKPGTAQPAPAYSGVRVRPADGSWGGTGRENTQ